MGKIKIVVVIVLCVAGLASLYYGFTAPVKCRTVVAAAVAAEPAIPSQQSLPSSQPQGASYKRHASRTKFTGWGSEPFSHKRSESARSENEFSLSGILYDQHSPSAIINDKVLGVGDIIGNFMVIRIDPDQVVLSDGQKEVSVKLSR